ncbi:hypothetical protein HAX54_049137, partial [Datura stramonium]|nr:hypothetical protein [Datura stramonium]
EVIGSSMNYEPIRCKEFNGPTDKKSVLLVLIVELHQEVGDFMEGFPTSSLVDRYMLLIRSQDDISNK